MSALIKKNKCIPQIPATSHKHWNTCYLQLGSAKQKPFKCCDCKFTAKSKMEVRRHYSVHLVEEPFVCNVPHCQFRTRFSSSLYTHKKRHEREERGEMPFECDYPGCEYKTGAKAALKNHRMGKHEAKSKPFACSFLNCNFRSNWKASLSKHEQTHDPNRPKPFECPICKESFYHNAHLQVHILTHTKEGAHKCPHCSYSAPFLSRVNYHVRSRHPLPHEPKITWKKKLLETRKQHKCSICIFSSDYISKLNKHLVNVHRPTIGAVKRAPSFGCKFCDFRSHAMTKLEEHLLLHSDLQPHASTVSGYDFRIKWTGNMKPYGTRLRASKGLGEPDIALHSLAHAVPVVQIERLEIRWL